MGNKKNKELRKVCLRKRKRKVGIKKPAVSGVRAKRKAEALLNPQDRIDDTSAPNPETAGPSSQPPGTPLPPADTLAQPDNGTFQNIAHESNPLPAVPPAPLAKRISRPPSDPHLQEIYANHIKVIKKKPLKRKSSEVACSVCSRTLRKTLLRCLQCARVLCGPCDRRRVTACTTQNHVMLRVHSSATYDKLSHLLDEWQRDVVAAVGEPPASEEDEEADTTTIEPIAANLIDDQSLLVPIDNSMSKYMALPVAPPEPNTIPEKPKPFEHPSGRVFRGRKPQNKNDKPKDKTKEPHVDNEPMIYNPVPFQPVVDLFATEAIKPEPDPLLGLDAAPQGTVGHGQPIGRTTVDGSIPGEGDPGAPPVEVKMEPQELITIEEMDVNVAVADTNVSPSEPYVFELYSSHKPAPS
ncbi:uncharacterized protein LOC105383676 isoform X2 [Plutella xylostella]|uniref:uncharacterized protein LOC105383676 isoform X2 n=1 Tax=Plutella xylostella TaxID=51655 RepID=UPI0020326E0F|nr:uncharacterized protein LOC105383676 isoform X2 [Plutella xylostella]